jgi:hypothetical protein
LFLRLIRPTCTHRKRKRLPQHSSPSAISRKARNISQLLSFHFASISIISLISLIRASFHWPTFATFKQLVFAPTTCSSVTLSLSLSLGICSSQSSRYLHMSFRQTNSAVRSHFEVSVWRQKQVHSRSSSSSCFGCLFIQLSSNFAQQFRSNSLSNLPSSTLVRIGFFARHCRFLVTISKHTPSSSNHFRTRTKSTLIAFVSLNSPSSVDLRSFLILSVSIRLVSSRPFD